MIFILTRRKTSWLQHVKIAGNPSTNTTGTGREKPACVGLVTCKESLQKKDLGGAIPSLIVSNAASSTSTHQTNPESVLGVLEQWRRR